MLLKDHDMSEEGKALLDRTASFDEARLDVTATEAHATAEAEATSSPRASLHTLSAPPQYYPPVPQPEARRLFNYPTYPPSDLRPPQASAHVSHTTDRNLTLSAILDLNRSMPPLIPFPQAYLTGTRKKENVNGLFAAHRGKVDLRLAFVGREPVFEREAEGGSSSSSAHRQTPKVPRDRIKVYVHSQEKMKVECLSRTPSTVPISLRLNTPSNITLILPRDFRGPVHLVNCARATHTLSPAVQQSYTHISSDPPLSFIGSIKGWSGASPTEEENAVSSPFAPVFGWLGLGDSTASGTTADATLARNGFDGPRLDELWIDVDDRSSKISISFAGEEDEGRTGRDAGVSALSGWGGTTKAKRGVFDTFFFHLCSAFEALCTCSSSLADDENNGLLEGMSSDLPRSSS